MEGAWTLDGSRLSYRFDDGLVIHPTAREIWAAEFAGSRIACGRAIYSSPSSNIPNLGFSRIPADIILRVQGSLISGLFVDLIARVETSIIPLPSSHVPVVQDQLIESGWWYPIDIDAVEALIAELRVNGIPTLGQISLGQFIGLRRLTHISRNVLDQAQTDPASTLHSFSHKNVPIEGLVARLYDYQCDGIEFLRLVAGQGLGCILGDEMGLGKTLQVIALLQVEKTARRTPSLVVAPATLLENWRREFSIFAPQLRVGIHAGAERAGIKDRLSSFEVVITSYETAVRDEPLLTSIRWNIVALDEAQNIKNPTAQRTRAVKALDRRVSIAVTGTPVENRLSDLWSVSNFVLPSLLGSLKDFEREFENSTDDASRLAPLVAPILLRRKVSEVAQDLPPRIDIPQTIPMTHDMAIAYERIRMEAVAEYGAAANLVALQRLRMFCAHPRLVGLWEGFPLVAMPKYQRLVEILEEIIACEEKALIFSTYNGMADFFIQDLPSRFPGAYFNYIDGRIPVPRRQPMVDNFSEHDGGGALILNPKAAGVGLNITAANHVIHYNPEWNPAVEDQASARAYRRKQTRPVTIHHLFHSDSLEEVMMDRLKLKRAIADGALTGHGGNATSADVLRALSISPLTHRGEVE